MANEKKYDEEFGVAQPLSEARSLFSDVTRDELAEVGAPDSSLIPDGHIEVTLFKGHEVRRICHNGEWLFSIVDVIGAVTDSDRPSGYWNDLRGKMSKDEGFDELYDNIGKLPLPGADGKSRPTEVANAETLFRIIQSVPSKKAEPVKRWLAKVGYERILETQDPELAIKRAILTYQLQGRSDDWIEKRIRSIVSRKELTREWQKRGVKDSKEYAMLSNIISEQTFGLASSATSASRG